MNVPRDVQANVAGADAPAPRKRARQTANRVGAARYVSRTGAGWRFQMRLPGRFAFAGAGSTIRAALGPRSRPEARRLGRQLATLCTAICEAADVGQQEPATAAENRNPPAITVAEIGPDQPEKKETATEKAAPLTMPAIVPYIRVYGGHCTPQ